LGKWNLNTGQFDRYMINGCAYAFGLNLITDHATGRIFKLNPNTAIDDGEYMRFVRTFIHMVGGDFQRVIYKSLSANIQPGTSDKEVGNEDEDNEPYVFLSWSDDRGKTFGFSIAQSLGRQGEYLTDPQWNRLG